MAREAKDGQWTGDKKSIWTEKDGDNITGDDGTFTWDFCDAQRMRHLCAVAGKAGHAVSFAQNRANSGGTVTILDGPLRPRWYCHDSISAGELLNRLISRYEKSGPPSPE